MKRISSYASAFLAVIVMSFSMLPAGLAAADSAGLSINPKKNYTIQPGQTIQDKLSIGNLDSTSDLNVSLRMVDFTYSDESGTPKLNLADNANPTSWSLRPFTTLPKTVSVPKGSTKSVNFSITIPKSLGAGSYYSAIVYQSTSTNGGNVALNASGVTLAFATVPGQVNEKMTLQKFGAYNSEDNGTTGNFVYIAMNGAPKMLAYALKNEGNVFESPSGNIILKDMFGHQVANISTNTTSSLALIGQTRLFTSCIQTVQQTVKALGGTSKNDSCVDPKLKPGRYTASLDAFYGQNGNQTHEITATAHFWYLPIWFLVLLVVLLALIVFGIWWLKRKITAVVKGTSYKAGKGISRRH